MPLCLSHDAEQKPELLGMSSSSSLPAGGDCGESSRKHILYDSPTEPCKGISSGFNFLYLEQLKRNYVCQLFTAITEELCPNTSNQTSTQKTLLSSSVLFFSFLLFVFIFMLSRS